MNDYYPLFSLSIQWSLALPIIQEIHYFYWHQFEKKQHVRAWATITSLTELCQTT